MKRKIVAETKANCRNSLTMIAVRTFLLVIAIGVSALLFFTQSVAAQAPEAKRGFQAGGSYALSDIETISTTNGNLMMRFPLGNLPSGRGGMSGGLTLFYDSKIYDTTTLTNEDLGCQPTSEYPKRIKQQEMLGVSATGGWRYGYEYKLEVKDRLEQYGFDREQGPQYPDPATITRWKLVMTFPDGSSHPFEQRGYGQTVTGDGYSTMRADGRYQVWGGACNGHQSCADTSQINGPLFYYSTDGTYLRLVVEHDSDSYWWTNPWTLYFPDGGKVTSTTIDSGGVYHQLSYDRNGNSLDTQVLTLTNSHQAIRLVDPVTGRYTQLEKKAAENEDWITQSGVGGTEIKWRIKWKQIQVVREYVTEALQNRPVSCDIDGYPFLMKTNMAVVDQIILPSQAGNLSYTFGYNGSDYSGTYQSNETTGWGELSSVRLPSGAEAEYSYKLDDLANNEEHEIWTGDVQMNSPTSKTLTYDLDYDSGPSDATETWTYAMNLPNDAARGGSSVVTGPDGGVTTEAFDQFHNVFWSGKPDGTVVERLWAQNVPVSYPVPLPGLQYSPQSVNFYLQAEVITIKNYAGSPTLTAIKEYEYDKNGNTTKVKEYGFVAASTIPRNGYGQLTGLPSGLTPLRISAGGFHAATPAATDSSTADSDAYYTYQITGAFKHLRATQWSEVQDGSGTPKSRSEIYYDGATAMATAPTYGNPTKQLAWDSFKGGTTRAYSDPLSSANANEVTTAYNSYGMPTLVTDANGVQTQITYGTITGPSGSYTDLYPTETKTAYGTAVEKTSAAAYDFYTGVVTTATDVDNNVSSVTTYDVFGRPTLVKAAYNTAVETRTAITYDDAERRVITRSDLGVMGDGKIVKIQHYDRLGRIWLTRSLEDPATESATDVQDGIKVQTRYGYVDSGGDHFTYQLSSNPYRASSTSGASSEVEMGWTRSISLANGRLSSVETFTSAAVPVPDASGLTSTGKVVTLSDANKTYVRDQADKWRMSETNALGQLVKVTEDPTSAFTDLTHTGTNLLTEYSYDTLSNLTGVSQAYSGGTQTRTFTYSSAARLLTAANPESGTIGYQYDANGNLTHKQDARGVDTSYVYDYLNRPTTRTYDDGTPTVTYTYDGSGVPFGKGRLASVSSSVSTTSYTKYDATGKLLESSQTTDGLAVCTGSSAACLLTYKYNLAGALTEESYPSGRVVHHNYAADGKLAATSSRVTDKRPFKAYAQNFTYNAAGAVTDMQLGNMRWEHTEFNARLQPVKIALGTTAGVDDMLNLQYGYGTTANNGNVLSQTIKVENVGATAGFEAVQTYTYDELNRLKSATENNTPNGGSQSQSWKQTYSFDRFGNRRFDTTSGATTTIPGTCSTAVCNPTFDLSNNRFASGQGYSYDSAGNVTDDADGKKFVYDAENKQKSFGTGGDDDNGGTYFYDGGGQRVKKVVDSETSIFVFDAFGKTVAEYTTTTPSAPDIGFTTLDFLGTPRINTDSIGNVKARHDYLPYGEDAFASGSRVSITGYDDDGITRKFTGKERDGETESDFFGARYYKSRLGRFTSSDPLLASGNPVSPQSWNRYSYTLNNPVRFTDPSGLFTIDPKLYKTWHGAKQAQQILSAYEALKASLTKAKAGSKDYKRIERALAELGAPGQKNGVVLTVGATQKDTSGAQTDPGSKLGAKTADNPTGQNIVITFNENKFDGIDETDRAAVLGHEATHASDFTNLILSGGMRNIWDRFNKIRYNSEFEAFSTQGAVAQALSPNDAYNVAEVILPMPNSKGTLPVQVSLWDPHWITVPAYNSVDVQTLRSSSVSFLLNSTKANGGYGLTSPK